MVESSPVRVRPHPRRYRVEFRSPTFSPSILPVAIDEAEEIVVAQGYVSGYQSEEQAVQIRRGLRARGIRTRVYADVGPPITPRTNIEARVIRDLGLEPGRRYVLWGVRKVGPSKH